jgi:hypothetical protein
MRCISSTGPYSPGKEGTRIDISQIPLNAPPSKPSIPNTVPSWDFTQSAAKTTFFELPLAGMTTSLSPFQ